MDECFSVSDRDRAFSQTDILILCVRYYDHTRGSIGAHELETLKIGAYLINIARGGLVDDDALLGALDRGQLAGAGLDVFSREPVAVTHPLLKVPNVIMTPHIAGVTEDSFNSIADVVAANIERLRRGQPVVNQVV